MTQDQSPMSQSEASILEDLNRNLEQRRAELGTSEPEPAKPKFRIPIIAPLTDEERKQVEREEQEREQRKANEKRYRAWLELVEHRGERYESCHLKTFEATTPEQQKCIESVRSYLSKAAENVKAGRGVVLFGPKGTGKDHLAMAISREFIRNDFRVRWQNGMDMFGDIRDMMDDGDSERSFVERLVRPDVLYLSDPLPPFGSLTDFQASMLFRILDGRYSRAKPIVCTVNVKSGSELDERMGPQNGDRLRDNALAIFCNWPSHRRTV